MDEQEIVTFFQQYSEHVDGVDKVSAFWRLSDKIIEELIKREIGPYVEESSDVLDAGGGTARWAIKLASKMPCRFTVLDRSQAMLKRAEENLAEHPNLSDRIRLIEGDLTCMSQIPNESFDHAISVYSPISFILEQRKAIDEIARVLKPSGKLFIMAHGHFNAISSKMNNYYSSSFELTKLAEDHVVKWAEHVPHLATHSSETMQNLLRSSGFVPIKTFGIPVFAQPDPEDFDPESKSASRISRYLEDPETFATIFNIEMRHNGILEIVNRGMNIFCLAKKDQTRA